jgi:outer membrane protein assembly factor BamB
MRRRVTALLCLSIAFACVATPQGRPVDWPSYGGDARRTGWEKSDVRITPDNVKDFQLVLKRKLENQQSGQYALTPPVVVGLLISYRGFKELGFVAGSSGNLWSIDLDVNKVFWQKNFPSGTEKSAACSGRVTAFPALTPPTIFGGRRPAPAKTSQSPGLPPTPAGRNTEMPARVTGTGFGAPRPVYVLTGDGQLHLVNTSDGNDQFPPLPFLPANAKAAPLTLHDYVMYTTTNSGCGGVPNAVWALDLRVEDPKAVSFPLNGGAAGGLGGYALGNDGTVYVQTGPGPSDPASNKYSNTLLALEPKDLKLRGHFSVASETKAPAEMNVTTPVVFEYKGRDLVVSAGRDGRLYVLDSQSVGGSDHKTPLSQTVPVATGNGGFWGGLSSWEDADGTRWVAAPVWGAVNPELKVPAANGAAPNGSIVAFKLDEQNGAPVLVPAWISRDLKSPVPPVVTSGVVFALSTSGRAVLYGLDATTGKELYSTGNQVSAPAALTGMTVANGRVFFTTTDNTLYGFGIFLEI